LRALISITAALLAAGALAQAYPAKAVRVIVPFPPGGSADAASRSMAEKLAGLWGQPVVLKHKPGAGTTIPSVAGFIAPAGTPRETVAFINASMGKALATSELRERLNGLGFEPFASTPEDFGAFLAAELRRYAQVIRDAGIKVD
jgi:tripartite-type tricarboxylate transporter receptor subunit TctC